MKRSTVALLCVVPYILFLVGGIGSALYEIFNAEPLIGAIFVVGFLSVLLAAYGIRLTEKDNG